MNFCVRALLLITVLALGGCEGVHIVLGPGGGPGGGPGSTGQPPASPPSGQPPSNPPSSPPASPPASGYGPSLADLDAMASRMLTVGAANTGLTGSIVDDANKSGGVAAIGFRGNDSIIYVHPDRRREWSVNTWAFIIGHELSHALLQHEAGGPQAERAADRKGAVLASQAGYDVSEYIAFICSSQPNSCSQSHGCFHDRMRKLEEQFQVSACDSRDADHAGHALALGLSALGTPPPSWTGTCILELEQ